MSTTIFSSDKDNSSNQYSESTNLFFIKTFSRFARAYPPALAQLSNPIPETEFLEFVDGLNNAFVSAPAFQAMHVASGMLVGAQGVIPVQVVGAVLQVGSLAGSVAVSMIRTKRFLKKANKHMFGPRGLTCQLMTTKKMMAAVGFSDTDEKGNLKLPPLSNISDLKNYEAMASNQTGIEDLSPTGAEDPRLRRLRALDGYVAPLNFDVPDDTHKRNWLVQKTEVPLKWLGNKQMKKIDKVRDQTLKKREAKAPEIEAEVLKAQGKIEAIELKIAQIREEYNDKMTMFKGAEQEKILVQVETDKHIKELEAERALEMQTRDLHIQEIYSTSDKKLRKVYLKEEKIANRILWIVITKGDGTGELIHIDTDTEERADSY